MRSVGKALYRFSLTTRLVVAGSVVAAALWLALDVRHTARIEHMVRENLTAHLLEEARIDRLRLDDTVRAHHDLTSLVARHAPVIARAQAMGRDPVRSFREPDWLPPRSERRAFPLVNWMLLFDASGVLGEAHGLMAEPIPDGLSSIERRLLVMAEEQTHIIALGGVPYLLSTAAVAGTGARLAALSRLDSRFLAHVFGNRGREGHVEVLVADGAVIASSQLHLLAPGARIEEVERDWLLAGQAFFDYGSSEVMVKFLTLYPRAAIDADTAPLLAIERSQRTGLALSLSALFLIVLVVLAMRVRAATRRVAHVTETVFGLPPQRDDGGDEIRALIRQVERLSDEVVASREALRREAAVRLHMATARMRVEAENDRLRLLKAVTELVGVGVVRLTEDGPVAENEVMTRLGEECGGLLPFLRARASGRDEVVLCGRTFALSLASALDPGLVLVQDVTERRRAESMVRETMDELERRVAERTHDLVAAKEQAELANRTKTEFLATVSHELRTPLNAVIGFAEVMAGEMFGPLGNERYRQYAEDILSSGRHLLDVINDILDVARIEEGHMRLMLEPVRVPDLIAAAVRLMDGRAGEKGITLATDIADEVPMIRGDRRRLLQVLVNLLSNAIKFTPAGGTITVSAGDDDGNLVISVSDTGIGMDDSQVKLALQPFRQVDGRLERLYEGAGLGLPLAKAFTELHGGGLLVTSRPGQGTCVTVNIPSREDLALQAG